MDEQKTHFDYLKDQYAKHQAAFFEAMQKNEVAQREIDCYDPSDDRHAAALTAAGNALRESCLRHAELEKAVDEMMNCAKAEARKRGITVN